MAILSHTQIKINGLDIFLPETPIIGPKTDHLSIVKFSPDYSYWGGVIMGWRKINKEYIKFANVKYYSRFLAVANGEWAWCLLNHAYFLPQEFYIKDI